MSAYAVCHLREMNVNRDVVLYLHKIDATLEPFDGRFLVHGKESETVEGEFPGHLIIIEFPDCAHARDWYFSDAYQDIAPLRSRNSNSNVVLVDGVPPGYKAADMLSN